MADSFTPTSDWSSSRRPGQRSDFASTQWSVVLSAARSNEQSSRAALETLCRAYWRPLYAYARRKGNSRENAEDLVQGFFGSFLAKNLVAQVERDRGRFRAFLLACLKHYMLDEWKRRRTRKRGGQVTHLPLDWEDAEARYQIEASNAPTPDRLFDREWALTLIARVLSQLRQEYENDGKAEQFEALRDCLALSREAVPYEQAAARLEVSVGNVRVIVHRLRKRYRVLLREEVARTLLPGEPLEDEMKALMKALAK